MTRIPFVDESTLSPEVREALSTSPHSITRVMCNASDTIVPWFAAVGGIRRSPDLDPVLREMVILRAASRVGGEYEMMAHTPVARAAGATEAQIEAACSGAPLEGTVGTIVAVVDDLFQGHGLSDERVAGALELISARALVEAILIAGVYTTIGRLFDAAGLNSELLATS